MKIATQGLEVVWEGRMRYFEGIDKGQSQKIGDGVNADTPYRAWEILLDVESDF